MRSVIPNSFYQKRIHKILLSDNQYDAEYVIKRLSYYNKFNSPRELGNDAILLSEMNKVKGPSAYFIDTHESTRYFRDSLKVNVLFKDVIHVPDVPTLQKSRPIGEHNENAVILKMDKRRHFFFVKDPYSFSEKKDMLIGRSSIDAPNSPQPHRVRFMEMYFNHPLCDLGQVNKAGGNQDWLKPKISIIDHLKYKFILSLEGNDVATNLKWIMSSSSIAVMPMPKYETWFMEGTLIPDFHFICIKSDYTDLEERLRYYIDRPEEAHRIVRNANTYVKQFLDKQLENLISLLVLQNYFYYTGQITEMEFMRTKFNVEKSI